MNSVISVYDMAETAYEPRGEESKEERSIKKESACIAIIPQAVRDMVAKPRWIYPGICHIAPNKNHFIVSELPIQTNSPLTILTGINFEGEIIENDPVFQYIYHHSTLIFQKIKEIISINFLSRNFKQFEPNSVQGAIREYQKQSMILQATRKKCDYSITWDKKIENSIETISKNKSGNCEELSLLYISYFRKLNSNLSIELAVYEEGDHSFVIINRGSEGFSKAVFIDPWALTITKALRSILPYDCKGILFTQSQENHTLSCPIVRRYDVSKGIGYIMFKEPETLSLKKSKRLKKYTSTTQ